MVFQFPDSQIACPLPPQGIGPTRFSMHFFLYIAQKDDPKCL